MWQALKDLFDAEPELVVPNNTFHGRARSYDDRLAADTPR
jgi:hypothetical protein